MDRYELRQSQLQMAEEVQKTIAKGGVLLAEAGTGTGKTLAYLVPAILSQLPTVISTGTKNLQEQIFFKDIQFLQKTMDTEIDAVYLKGQDNYLCLTRLGQFLSSPRVLEHSPQKVAELTKWADRTETGDRMEISSLEDEDPIWREICSTRDTRIGSNCPHYTDCFVTKARGAAMRAKLVITNHHLYFADLAMRLKGASILPSHDVAIFDEAHGLEDIATEFFSFSVSPGRIKRILRDALIAVGSAKLQEDHGEKERHKLADRASKLADGFFSYFRGMTEGRSALQPEEIQGEVQDAYFRLDAGLDAVEQSLKLLEGRDQGIDKAANRIAEMRDDLNRIVTREEKGYVHWRETRRRSVIVGASPIDVSEYLRDGIFFSIPSVILTSATLSAGGNFKFLKSRLGIDFESSELSQASPFDYQNQAILYLPSHMPDPRDHDFCDAAAAEIHELVQITRGGALVLFTSIKNLTKTSSLLRDDFGLSVLVQGEKPKGALIQEFTEGGSAVLAATASFWQGVDIPGNPLRLVIIDKLPFASPGDPLVAARVDLLQAQGRKPFVEYQVPAAALLLKQGVGRLIRTRYDYGIIAILDKRLRTMPYAKTFLASLPQTGRAESMEEIRSWWNKTTLVNAGGEKFLHQ